MQVLSNIMSEGRMDASSSGANFDLHSTSLQATMFLNAIQERASHQPTLPEKLR